MSSFLKEGVSAFRGWRILFQQSLAELKKSTNSSVLDEASRSHLNTDITRRENKIADLQTKLHESHLKHISGDLLMYNHVTDVEEAGKDPKDSYAQVRDFQIRRAAIALRTYHEQKGDLPKDKDPTEAINAEAEKQVGQYLPKEYNRAAIDRVKALGLDSKETIQLASKTLEAKRLENQAIIAEAAHQKAIAATTSARASASKADTAQDKATIDKIKAAETNDKLLITQAENRLKQAKVSPKTAWSLTGNNVTNQGAVDKDKTDRENTEKILEEAKKRGEERARQLKVTGYVLESSPKAKPAPTKPEAIPTIPFNVPVGSLYSPSTKTWWKDGKKVG